MSSRICPTVNPSEWRSDNARRSLPWESSARFIGTSGWGAGDRGTSGAAAGDGAGASIAGVGGGSGAGGAGGAGGERPVRQLAQPPAERLPADHDVLQLPRAAIPRIL